MSYTPKKGSKTSAILDFIYQNAGATTEVIAREFRVPPSKVYSMLELAIKGMIPHNKLGDHVYTKLKVYAGSEHPHTAQAPQKIEL